MRRGWFGGGARTMLCAAVVLVALLGWPAQPVGAADRQGVSFSAELDGRSLDEIDAEHPLLLAAGEPLQVRVEIRNGSAAPIFVRSVRLASSVGIVDLFLFVTRVDLPIAPGRSATTTFEVDVGDLDSQATGLLPARLTLLAPQRKTLASEAVMVDVRGSILSVYGVFGILVALATLVLLVTALQRLSRGRLSPNRWGRGTTFLSVGIGVALTVTFVLSVSRLFMASWMWGWLTAAGAVIGFAFGYLSPHGSTEVEPELPDDDIEVRETVEPDYSAESLEVPAADRPATP